MSQIKEHLITLLQQETWSAEDQRWLLNLLDTNDAEVLRDLLSERFIATLSLEFAGNDERAREILAQIHKKIRKEDPEGIKKIPFFRGKKVLSAVAAVFLLVTGYIGFQLFRPEGQNTSVPVATSTQRQEKKDLLPGQDKAVLTLGDGSVVILDDVSEGSIAQQSSVDIRKLNNGQLVYQGISASNELVYNSISTPRGGKFQITLADGTMVWLNAASSLRFPASFAGAERRVELTGEGYFEVAEDKQKPFIVNVAGKEEVVVLGTHFNINSYDNEESINTTLLEGSVKIRSVGSPLSKTMQPGQQHLLFAEGRSRLKNKVDTEETIAWKNDKFDFGEAMELKVVMRQIERWYNVDVDYQGDVSSIELGGSISRNVSASKVFEMLELTGVATFRIREGKVVVSAAKKQ